MKSAINRLMYLAALAIGAAITPSSFAQNSAHFRLREASLNSGGNPDQGSVLSAAHYRINFDAVGDPLARAGSSSASYRADGGFVGRYPPPGEALGLSFNNKTTLRWNQEKSIGTYQLYRGPISSLPGGGYGSCLQNALVNNSTTDTTSPSTGQGFFYLVTARNRLREEGTKGKRSSGVERQSLSPCP